MLISRICACGNHRPPGSATTCRRTCAQTGSESISTPSRSNNTAAGMRRFCREDRRALGWRTFSPTDPVRGFNDHMDDFVLVAGPGRVSPMHASWLSPARGAPRAGPAKPTHRNRAAVTATVAKLTDPS